MWCPNYLYKNGCDRSPPFYIQERDIGRIGDEMKKINCFIFVCLRYRGRSDLQEGGSGNECDRLLDLPQGGGMLALRSLLRPPSLLLLLLLLLLLPPLRPTTSKRSAAYADDGAAPLLQLLLEPPIQLPPKANHIFNLWRLARSARSPPVETLHVLCF